MDRSACARPKEVAQEKGKSNRTWVAVKLSPLGYYYTAAGGGGGLMQGLVVRSTEGTRSQDKSIPWG